MAVTSDPGGVAVVLVDADAVNIAPEAVHPKMRIGVIGGGADVSIEVPFAPNEVEITDISASWATVARPGRSPLVVASGTQLPAVTFEMTVADPAGASIGDILTDLRTVAERPDLAVVITGMPAIEAYGVTGWRITQCSIRTEVLERGTNAPLVARVTLGLLARSDAAVTLAPSRQSSTPEPTFIQPAPGAPPVIPAPTAVAPPAPVSTVPPAAGVVGGVTPRNIGTPGNAYNAGFIAGNYALNRIAWQGICRMLGRPVSDWLKVAAEAGYSDPMSPPPSGTVIVVAAGDGKGRSIRLA